MLTRTGLRSAASPDGRGVAWTEGKRKCRGLLALCLEPDPETSPTTLPPSSMGSTSMLRASSAGGPSTPSSDEKPPPSS